MLSERAQIEKAKDLLLNLANGVDPIYGELIDEKSFLNDPQMIRCFYYVSEILDNVISGSYSKRRNLPFSISPAQKKSIILPKGKIGINEFAKRVNSALDIHEKKLSGTEINKKLKQMKILGEMKDEEGKTSTITNDTSFQYGFETEHRLFNGKEYNKVLINDAGKKYLLENIETIMSTMTSA